ncbi:MAG: hypothetical protein ACW98D_01545 [Promethearchaeota archaeon]
MAFPSFMYHLIFGSISFILVLISALLGAMFVGRFGESKGHKELFKLHKYTGIITGVIVVFTFIFMIAPPYFAMETIVLDIHGWLSVIVLLIIILQVSLSLIIKKRFKLRKLHMYFGYIMLILITYQVANGLYLITY